MFYGAWGISQSKSIRYLGLLEASAVDTMQELGQHISFNNILQLIYKDTAYETKHSQLRFLTRERSDAHVLALEGPPHSSPCNSPPTLY